MITVYRPAEHKIQVNRWPHSDESRGAREDMGTWRRCSERDAATSGRLRPM